MAEPFKSPQQRGADAQREFIETYKAKLAITLKKGWSKDDMRMMGWKPEMGGPDGNPTDEQFQQWANEIIEERGFTIRDRTGKPIKRIDITTMQNSLSPEAKVDLAKEFGTDQLRDIILTKDQLYAASQQINKATEGRSGSISFLGGATIMDAIMGFFEWMMSGFTNGFSGLKDAIATRATNGVGSDLNNLLATNVPTISPAMRTYLAGKTTEKARELAGLKEAGPAETISGVTVGQDVRTPSPEVGNRPAPGAAAAVPAPAPATGDPSRDLPDFFGQIVDAVRAPRDRGGLNLTDERIRTMGGDKALSDFAASVRVFKEEGTRLAMDPASRGLSRQDFAKKLIDDTKARLLRPKGQGGEGLDPSMMNDPAMQVVMDELQRRIEANYDNIRARADGRAAASPALTPAAPLPPAPGGAAAPSAGIEDATITRLVDASLRDRANREQLDMIAGVPLSDANLEALRDAVKPVMIKYASSDTPNAELIARRPPYNKDTNRSAYDVLAEEMFRKLQENQAKINPAGGQLDNQALQVLAKRMAKEYIEVGVNKQKQTPPGPILIQPDPDFNDTLKADEMRLTNRVVESMRQQRRGPLEAEITGKMTEALKGKAMEALTGNANSAVASPGQLIDLAVSRGLMGRTKAFAARRASLVDVTRDDALVIARRTGAAPNEAQTRMISQIIAQSTIDVTTNQDFRGNQRAFEEAVKREITARLQANAEQINGLGNPGAAGGSTTRALWRHGSSLTWQQYSDEVLPQSGFRVNDMIGDFAGIASGMAGQRFTTDVAPLQDKVRGKGVFRDERTATMPASAEITPGMDRARAMAAAR